MAVYPHKQSVIILVVCVLAVGGFAAYVYRPTAQRSYDSKSKMIAETSSYNIVSPVDTDWQKQFLSTTTGSAFKAVGGSSNNEPSEKLTSTDVLGHSFITRYAQLHEIGLTGDSGSVSAVMDQAIFDSVPSLPQPKFYTSKDVRVVEDNQNSLSSYDSAVSLIHSYYTGSSDAAALAMKAFDDDDFTELASIDKIVSEYKTMISRLLLMPVPSSLSAAHVDLLNGFSGALYSAEAFRHIDTDPLPALAAIKLDAVSVQTILGAFKKMNL